MLLFPHMIDLHTDDEETLKGLLEVPPSTQPDNRCPPCPCCGAKASEPLPLVRYDTLLESHLELCAELRQIGRRLLNSDDEHLSSMAKSQLLDRMRRVLRRADHFRRNWKPAMIGSAVEGPTGDSTVPLECGLDCRLPEPIQIEISLNRACKSTAKNPVTRRRAQAVIQFPASQ